MRARLLPVSYAAASPILLVGLVAGLRGQALVACAAVGALLGVVAWARRAAPDGEPAWTGPAVSLDGRRGSPAVAIATVEARELLLNPWFGGGAGTSALVLLLLGVFGSGDPSGSWGEFIDDMPFAAHPLLGFIAIAVHFAVTRSRRHGCDELFSTFPVTRGTRVLGHLGVAPLSVAIVLGYVGLFLLSVYIGNDTLYGSRAEGLAPTLLACTVLAAGAVALGSMTGRWLRWGIAPIAALVLIVLIGTWATSPQRWVGREALASANVADDVERLFVETRLWLNVLWLAAIASLLASLALLGARQWARATAVVAALAAVLAAVLIVQPMSEEKAQASAVLLADPFAHQSCESIDVVKVCAYEKYADHTEDVASVLRPVVAAIPAAARRPVTFAQLPPVDTANLPAEVMDALDGRTPAWPAGAHDLGFGASNDEFRAAALRIAAITVGLPAEPSTSGAQVVAGEARGVVVLWLGTRGLDVRAARRVATGEFDDSGETGRAWPTECGRGGALIWSRHDLAAARAVVALPEAKVATVVERDWARWAEPTTPTNELMDALGLPHVNAPAPNPGAEVGGYTC